MRMRNRLKQNTRGLVLSLLLLMVSFTGWAAGPGVGDGVSSDGSYRLDRIECILRPERCRRAEPPISDPRCAVGADVCYSLIDLNLRDCCLRGRTLIECAFEDYPSARIRDERIARNITSACQAGVTNFNYSTRTGHDLVSRAGPSGYCCGTDGLAPPTAPIRSCLPSEECTEPPPPPATADLQVTKTASRERVRPGEDVTFTIRVTNIGHGSTTDILVVDEIPAGFRIVDPLPLVDINPLIPGQNRECGRLGGVVSCDTRLFPSLPGGGRPHLIVSPDTISCDPSRGICGQPNVVQVTINAQATGERCGAITNYVNAIDVNAVESAREPNSLWENNRSSATVTVDCPCDMGPMEILRRGSSAASPEDFYREHSDATGRLTTSDYRDYCACASRLGTSDSRFLCSPPPAPLPIVKKALEGPSTVSVGTEVRFKISVINNGDVPSRPVILRDVLRDDLGFVGYSSSRDGEPGLVCSGVLSSDGGTLRGFECRVPSLAPRTEHESTITARVTRASCPSVNTAEIRPDLPLVEMGPDLMRRLPGSEISTSGTRDSAEVSANTCPIPPITLEKLALSSRPATMDGRSGFLVDYVIKVGAPSGDVTNLRIVDLIDDGLRLHTASPDCEIALYYADPSRLVCNISRLIRGEDKVFNITVFSPGGEDVCRTVNNRAVAYRVIGTGDEEMIRSDAAEPVTLGRCSEPSTRRDPFSCTDIPDPAIRECCEPHQAEVRSAEEEFRRAIAGGTSAVASRLIGTLTRLYNSCGRQNQNSCSSLATVAASSIPGSSPGQSLICCFNCIANGSDTCSNLNVCNITTGDTINQSPTTQPFAPPQDTTRNPETQPVAPLPPQQNIVDAGRGTCLAEAAHPEDVIGGKTAGVGAGGRPVEIRVTARAPESSTGTRSFATANVLVLSQVGGESVYRLDSGAPDTSRGNRRMVLASTTPDQALSEQSWTLYAPPITDIRNVNLDGEFLVEAFDLAGTKKWEATCPMEPFVEAGGGGCGCRIEDRDSVNPLQDLILTLAFLMAVPGLLLVLKRRVAR